MLWSAALLVAAGCGPQQHSTTPPRERTGPGTEPEGRATPAAPHSRYLPPSCKRKPGAGLGSLSPVVWPMAKERLRQWRLERDLRVVKTTKASPVELCGAREQIVWLLRSRCPDGAPPYRNPRVAHASRAGSVGSGGRCGTMIDLYRVKCRSQTYMVYMSLYHCVPGKSPFGR